MMFNWGMRAFNQATGSVQIDERYANFALLAKVVVTTDFQADGTVGALLTVTGDSPEVAIRSDTHFVEQLYFTRSGSTWQFYIQAFNNDGTSAAGVAVTCYVYDKPGALIGPHGYGAAVRDAAGELTFHSSRKYMRVDALITGANYMSALPSGSFAAGKTYAIASAKLAGETTADNIGTGPIGGGPYLNSYFTRMLAFRWSGTTLTSADCLAVEIVREEPSALAPYTYTSANYAFMVLDVTHQ